jgi:hypothetical protein
MQTRTRRLLASPLLVGGLLGLGSCGSGSAEIGILINLANT